MKKLFFLKNKKKIPDLQAALPGHYKHMTRYFEHANFEFEYTLADQISFYLLKASLTC